MQYLNTQQFSSYVSEKKKLGDAFLLFVTDDFKRLTEYQFIGARAMVFVLKGTMEIFINGKEYVLSENNYSDILDGMLFRFGEISADAEAYCVFTTKSFMLEALQGVIPGRDNYLVRILSNPVMDFSGSRGMTRLDMLLKMLSGAVSDTSHKYRADMVRLYFKGLVLELSNLMSYLDKESPDFHKIGKLLLNDGRFNGVEVISKYWMNEVTKLQLETSSAYKKDRLFPKIGIGYYVFISRDGFIFRDGAIGQYIIVNKDKDILITIMSTEENMKNVTEIFRNII